LWVIVKSNGNCQKLSQSDVVKFGRVEYTVKEIKLNDQEEVDSDEEFEIEDIPEERE
jgi:hypothetical protein